MRVTGSSASRRGPGPPLRPPPQATRVLVIDDSAVVREILTSILSESGDFEVRTAMDGVLAESKIRSWRPEVIVLDLEMPRMHGLEFLRRLQESDPIPVVVCSSHASEGSAAALRALEEGAVDVVAKPRIGVSRFLQESSIRLIDAVRGAAASRGRHFRAGDTATPKPRLPAIPLGRGDIVRHDCIVAIGASTGGVEALRILLDGLSPDIPGILVVQHMPEGFTAAFASRLDRSSQLTIREARSGDELRRGDVLIAPGDRHMTVLRMGGRLLVDVADGPLVSRHRPSVDVLFRSVARAAGPRAIGVLLTGMGDDGARGLLEMRRAGAITLAQDEASSVVWGMPKEALALGAVDETIALNEMPWEISAAARRLGVVVQPPRSA